MGELINSRTQEEIKMGLRAHVAEEECKTCPYNDEKEVVAGHCIERLTKDVYALIERLESERDAALEKVPRWISVEERLPESDDEKSDCYLVTDGEFIWMAYYASKEWQFAHCTDSPYVIDWTDITHWMPMPEPLKEDA